MESCSGVQSLNFLAEARFLLSPISRIFRVTRFLIVAAVQGMVLT